jgi:tRNA (adenine22-N1)-methyltransferase
VADIGTDHARIPIYLLERGVTQSVIATEVREGPLAAATAALARHGLGGKAELRLGDGASCLSKDEVDCVIIAGMGGDTIAEILRADAWLLEKRLLLQPQTHGERVLAVLPGKSSVSVTRVWENTRKYTIYEFDGDKDL